MPESATGVALNTIEVRFTGGMLALNRLLMTLQNKRMPVAGFTLVTDSDGMRATILLDCSPESALRYTALISALEDVREAGPAETMEIALIETSRDWRELAEQSAVEAHEDDGTVLASGEPEKVGAFLAALGAEDAVRVGPVARPEARGGASSPRRIHSPRQRWSSPAGRPLLLWTSSSSPRRARRSRRSLTPSGSGRGRGPGCRIPEPRLSWS